MSRLVDRVTALIAVLAGRPGEPFPLRALADAVALPPATCTRLLKDLVRLGWADQDGPRGDYRLGPRAYALTAAAPYRERQLAIARPAMVRLAADFPGTGVVLVVLRPWSRQVVWGCGVHPGPGAGQLSAEELWSGATGRMLVAMLPARKRGQWVDQVGLPSPSVWPGVATRAELLSALAEIRHEGRVELLRDQQGVWAGAVPLADGEGGWAALGAYQAAGRPRGALLERMAGLAAEASARCRA